jgi:hypothetical protein
MKLWESYPPMPSITQKIVHLLFFSFFLRPLPTASPSAPPFPLPLLLPSLHRLTNSFAQPILITALPPPIPFLGVIGLGVIVEMISVRIIGDTPPVAVVAALAASSAAVGPLKLASRRSRNECKAGAFMASGAGCTQCMMGRLTSTTVATKGHLANCITVCTLSIVSMAKDQSASAAIVLRVLVADAISGLRSRCSTEVFFNIAVA